MTAQLHRVFQAHHDRAFHDDRFRIANLRAIGISDDKASSGGRSGGRDLVELPPDEIDTMQEKEAIFADEHPDEPLERPYDPGGVSELNPEDERADQATPDGADDGGNDI